MAAGDFKPVSDILDQMDAKQKEILFEKCKAIVDKLDWSDAVFVAQLIIADQVLSKSLATVVSQHLAEQMNLKITMVD